MRLITAIVVALTGALLPSACDSGDGAHAGGQQKEKDKVVLELERLGRFKEPVFLAQPPGKGRPLYVVERAGRVLEVGSDGKSRAELFLDLRERVLAEGEGGLFSLAFAPDYEDSGLVYVNYAGRDLRVHLDEFRAVPGRAVRPASRRELIAVPHPEAVHWGGLVTFGPDELLYVSFGDGGPVLPLPSTAQDPNSLLGKILRLDPRPMGRRPYSTPADNPFAGPQPGADEVFALGLRNPWRYSFDRKTGDLWIGDVGDFTQEEIDYVRAERVAGANFGWPAFEGTEPNPDARPIPRAVEPILTYRRTGEEDDPNCAVTAGYVVRDRSLPSLLGRYVYADYCRGQIRSFKAVGGMAKDDSPTGLNVPRLVSFAEDQGGRLHAISLGGDVFRIAER